MSDVIVEIVVEVLTILAIATKEVKRGRFSELISCVFCHSFLTGYSEKYLKKLAGKREMEDSLKRLDKLTQEEARMASAVQLKMVQDVRGDVKDVGDKLEQANRSFFL